MQTRDEVHYIISRNIKKYRTLAGLTQLKLSELIDISYDYFRTIESEKGQKDFKLYTIYKIAYSLGISIDKLFEGINIIER